MHDALECSTLWTREAGQQALGSCKLLKPRKSSATLYIRKYHAKAFSSKPSSVCLCLTCLHTVKWSESLGWSYPVSLLMRKIGFDLHRIRAMSLSLQIMPFNAAWYDKDSRLVSWSWELLCAFLPLSLSLYPSHEWLPQRLPACIVGSFRLIPMTFSLLHKIMNS